MSFDRVRRAAERYYGALNRATEEVLRQLSASVPEAELIRAVEAGRVADLVGSLFGDQAAAVALLVGPLERMARAASRAGAEWALDETGRGRAGPFTIDFNRVDQAASDWARTHATELIRGLSDEARQTIIDIVARGPVEGLSVDVKARLLRGVVGLNSRQAQGATNRALGIVRRMQEGMTGAESRAAWRSYDRWVAHQLRLRRLTIARTETGRAQFASTRIGFAEAQAEGLLPPDARIGWLAEADACDICAGYADQSWPVGSQPDYPHPNCRCDTFLVQESAKVMKPLGRFPDFAACVTSMSRRLGSQEAARRYCGKLQSLIEGSAGGK